MGGEEQKRAIKADFGIGDPKGVKEATQEKKLRPRRRGKAPKGVRENSEGGGDLSLLGGSKKKSVSRRGRAHERGGPPQKRKGKCHTKKKKKRQGG